MNRSFKQWALSRIYKDAYNRMDTITKIAFWLESWCSYYYGREIMCHQNNRIRSPSGLQWAIYEVPWYGKYISKMEFQFRYLTTKRLPPNVTGRFPFYRRKNDIS